MDSVVSPGVDAKIDSALAWIVQNFANPIVRSELFRQHISPWLRHIHQSFKWDNSLSPIEFEVCFCVCFLGFFITLLATCLPLTVYYCTGEPNYNTDIYDLPEDGSDDEDTEGDEEGDEKEDGAEESDSSQESADSKSKKRSAGPVRQRKNARKETDC